MPMTNAQWVALAVAVASLAGAILLGILAVVLTDLPRGLRVEMLVLGAVSLMAGTPFAKYALTARRA